MFSVLKHFQILLVSFFSLMQQKKDFRENIYEDVLKHFGFEKKAQDII